MLLAGGACGAFAQTPLEIVIDPPMPEITLNPVEVDFDGTVTNAPERSATMVVVELDGLGVGESVEVSVEPNVPIRTCNLPPCAPYVAPDAVDVTPTTLVFDQDTTQRRVLVGVRDEQAAPSTDLIARVTSSTLTEHSLAAQTVRIPVSVKREFRFMVRPEAPDAAGGVTVVAGAAAPQPRQRIRAWLTGARLKEGEEVFPVLPVVARVRNEDGSAGAIVRPVPRVIPHSAPQSEAQGGRLTRSTPGGLVDLLVEANDVPLSTDNEIRSAFVAYDGASAEDATGEYDVARDGVVQESPELNATFEQSPNLEVLVRREFRFEFSPFDESNPRAIGAPITSLSLAAGESTRVRVALVGTGGDTLTHEDDPSTSDLVLTELPPDFMGNIPIDISGSTPRVGWEVGVVPAAGGMGPGIGLGVGVDPAGGTVAEALKAPGVCYAFAAAGAAMANAEFPFPAAAGDNDVVADNPNVGREDCVITLTAPSGAESRSTLAVAVQTSESGMQNSTPGRVFGGLSVWERHSGTAIANFFGLGDGDVFRGAELRVEVSEAAAPLELSFTPSTPEVTLTRVEVRSDGTMIGDNIPFSFGEVSVSLAGLAEGESVDIELTSDSSDAVPQLRELNFDHEYYSEDVRIIVITGSAAPRANFTLKVSTSTLNLNPGTSLAAQEVTIPVLIKREFDFRAQVELVNEDAADGGAVTVLAGAAGPQPAQRIRVWLTGALLKESEEVFPALPVVARALSEDGDAGAIVRLVPQVETTARGALSLGDLALTRSSPARVFDLLVRANDAPLSTDSEIRSVFASLGGPPGALPGASLGERYDVAHDGVAQFSEEMNATFEQSDDVGVRVRREFRFEFSRADEPGEPLTTLPLLPGESARVRVSLAGTGGDTLTAEDDASVLEMRAAPLPGFTGGVTPDEPPSTLTRVGWEIRTTPSAGGVRLDIGGDPADGALVEALKAPDACYALGVSGSSTATAELPFPAAGEGIAADNPNVGNADCVITLTAPFEEGVRSTVDVAVRTSGPGRQDVTPGLAFGGFHVSELNSAEAFADFFGLGDEDVFRGAELRVEVGAAEREYSLAFETNYLDPDLHAGAPAVGVPGEVTTAKASLVGPPLAAGESVTVTLSVVFGGVTKVGFSPSMLVFRGTNRETEVRLAAAAAAERRDWPLQVEAETPVGALFAAENLRVRVHRLVAPAFGEEVLSFALGSRAAVAVTTDPPLAFHRATADAFPDLAGAGHESATLTLSTSPGMDGTPDLRAVPGEVVLGTRGGEARSSQIWIEGVGSTTTATVDLTGVGDGVIAFGEASLQVEVVDPADFVLTLEPESLEAPEGAIVRFSIVAPRPLRTHLNVDYEIAGYAGVPGADPATEDDWDDLVGGALTLLAGETRATVGITIASNDGFEATTEAFSISLSEPPAGARYSRAPDDEVIVAIRPQGVLPASLSFDPPLPEVTLGSVEVAPDGTITGGSERASVTVTVSLDGLIGNERVTLSLMDEKLPDVVEAEPNRLIFTPDITQRQVEIRVGDRRAASSAVLTVGAVADESVFVGEMTAEERGLEETTLRVSVKREFRFALRPEEANDAGGVTVVAGAAAPQPGQRVRVWLTGARLKEGETVFASLPAVIRERAGAGAIMRLVPQVGAAPSITSPHDAGGLTGSAASRLFDLLVEANNAPLTTDGEVRSVFASLDSALGLDGAEERFDDGSGGYDVLRDRVARRSTELNATFEQSADLEVQVRREFGFEFSRLDAPGVPITSLPLLPGESARVRVALVGTGGETLTHEDDASTSVRLTPGLPPGFTGFIPPTTDTGGAVGWEIGTDPVAGGIGLDIGAVGVGPSNAAITAALNAPGACYAFDSSDGGAATARFPFPGVGEDHRVGADNPNVGGADCVITLTAPSEEGVRSTLEVAVQTSGPGMQSTTPSRVFGGFSVWARNSSVAIANFFGLGDGEVFRGADLRIEVGDAEREYSLAFETLYSDPGDDAPAFGVPGEETTATLSLTGPPLAADESVTVTLTALSGGVAKVRFTPSSVVFRGGETEAEVTLVTGASVERRDWPVQVEAELPVGAILDAENLLVRVNRIVTPVLGARALSLTLGSRANVTVTTSPPLAFHQGTADAFPGLVGAGHEQAAIGLSAGGSALGLTPREVVLGTGGGMTTSDEIEVEGVAASVPVLVTARGAGVGVTVFGEAELRVEVIDPDDFALRLEPQTITAAEGEAVEVAVVAPRALLTELSVGYEVAGYAGASGADPEATDEDYTDTGGGVVTIPAGETRAVIRIDVEDDGVFETATETFRVALSEPPAGARYTAAEGDGSAAVVAIRGQTLSPLAMSFDPPALETTLRSVEVGPDGTITGGSERVSATVTVSLDGLVGGESAKVRLIHEEFPDAAGVTPGLLTFTPETTRHRVEVWANDSRAAPSAVLAARVVEEDSVFVAARSAEQRRLDSEISMTVGREFRFAARPESANDAGGVTVVVGASARPAQQVRVWLTGARLNEDEEVFPFLPVVIREEIAMGGEAGAGAILDLVPQVATAARDASGGLSPGLSSGLSGSTPSRLFELLVEANNVPLTTDGEVRSVFVSLGDESGNGEYDVSQDGVTRESAALNATFGQSPDLEVLVRREFRFEFSYSDAPDAPITALGLLPGESATLRISLAGAGGDTLTHEDDLSVAELELVELPPGSPAIQNVPDTPTDTGGSVEWEAGITPSMSGVRLDIGVDPSGPAVAEDLKAPDVCYSFFSSGSGAATGEFPFPASGEGIEAGNPNVGNTDCVVTLTAPAEGEVRSTLAVAAQTTGSGMQNAMPSRVFGGFFEWAENNQVALPNFFILGDEDVYLESNLPIAPPRVSVGFTPLSESGDGALAVPLGSSGAVLVALTDFALLGRRTAEFEMTISGTGLSFVGGATRLRVALDAAETAMSVMVVAAADAESVGRLELRAVGEVGLAGGASSVSLPVEVLQPAALYFEPAEVVIGQGGAESFEVGITRLTADRSVAVTLEIADADFRFDDGAARREVSLNSGKTSERLMVTTTAPLGTAAQVAVSAVASAGVDLSALPELTLRTRALRATVVFSVPELVLTEGRAGTVGVSLANIIPVGNQEFVLAVAATGNVTLSGGSAVASLTAASPEAVIRVTGGAVGTGTLTVTALRGVELTEDAVLAVRVLPPPERVYALRFSPEFLDIDAAAPGATNRVTLAIEGGGTLREGELIEVGLTADVDLSASPVRVVLQRERTEETVSVSLREGARSAQTVTARALTTPPNVRVLPAVLTVSPPRSGSTLRIRVFLEGALE